MWIFRLTGLGYNLDSEWRPATHGRLYHKPLNLESFVWRQRNNVCALRRVNWSEENGSLVYKLYGLRLLARRKRTWAWAKAPESD